MSELYSEILVKREASSADTLKKVAIIVGIVLLVAAGIFITPMFLIGAVALGAGAYYIFPKFDVEYEYLVLNKELDVDAIYARKKRKNMGRYNLDSMDLMAPLNSHRMEYYNGNTRLTVKDYTSGKCDQNCYAMIIKSDHNTVKVLLELDRDTVENMKRTYPNKVFLD